MNNHSDSDHAVGGAILVVGAAGAIGSSIARVLRLRRPGARLWLADRDAAGIEALATALGDATPVAVDLADPSAVSALLDRVGPVSGLVNAAGIMDVRWFASMPWDRAARLLQVDLMAPLQLLHGWAAQRLAVGGGGFAINVTSMAGRVPLKGCGMYGAAKAGLSMASEIAHAELAQHGIRVVTVYPGPIRSPLEQGARGQYALTTTARWAPTGEPAALASVVVDAVERGAARVVFPRLYAIGWRAGDLASLVALGLGPSPTA